MTFMYHDSIQFGYTIHSYYFRIRLDYCTKFLKTRNVCIARYNHRPQNTYRQTVEAERLAFRTSRTILPCCAPCTTSAPPCSSSGCSRKVKFTRLTQTLGQLYQSLQGILSQTAVSAEKLWVNPVNFRFERGVRARRTVPEPAPGPHGRSGRRRRHSADDRRANAPPTVPRWRHQAHRR